MSLIELYGKKQNPKAAYVKLLSSLKGKNLSQFISFSRDAKTDKFIQVVIQA